MTHGCTHSNNKFINNISFVIIFFNIIHYYRRGAEFNIYEVDVKENLEEIQYNDEIKSILNTSK